MENSFPIEDTDGRCHGMESFHVHAIGSRGFGVSFDISDHFSDCIIFHNYEPDSEANEQTENFFSEKGIFQKVNPFAVYNKDGTIELNINYDPYTSSVFPVNSEYREFYFSYPPPAGDYIFGTAAAWHRQIEVPMVSLDNFSARTGTPVDWIAMDTQGAEFEILEGAGQCCATTLVGFSTEVEFHPLYEGQKLFNDIAALAVRHGFHLAGLTPHPTGSFRRAPLGWRGKGLMVAADVLFLKTVTAVRDGHPFPGLGLRKLAFASLCHGNVEHALDALEAAAEFAAPKTMPAWSRFLDRLWALHQDKPGVFPVSFTDVYSLDDSLARFAPDCRDQNDDPLRTAERFFKHTDPDLFASVLPALLSSRPTTFERLLTEHGLTGVGQLVRRNRQAAAFDNCRALGWFDSPFGPLAEAGCRIGGELAATGPVCFYGTGDMFAIADALLRLPGDVIGGVFDGAPSRWGQSIREHQVRPPSDVSGLSADAQIVLCTRASEAGMCRRLLEYGFRGTAISFDELLERICAAALEASGQGAKA